MNSVSGMASATIAASRQPSVRNSRMITTMMETTRWNTSSFTASFAVLPSFRVTVTVIPDGSWVFLSSSTLARISFDDLDGVQLLPLRKRNGHCRLLGALGIGRRRLPSRDAAD